MTHSIPRLNLEAAIQAVRQAAIENVAVRKTYKSQESSPGLQPLRFATEYESSTDLALSSSARLSRASSSSRRVASRTRADVSSVFGGRAPTQYESLSLGSQTYRPWSAGLVYERRKCRRPERADTGAAGAPSVRGPKDNAVVLGFDKQTFETDFTSNYSDRSAESCLELRDRLQDRATHASSSVVLGRRPDDWKTTFEADFQTPAESKPSGDRRRSETSAMTASYFRKAKQSSCNHTTDSVRLGPRQKAPEKQWESDFHLQFGAHPPPREGQLFKRDLLGSRKVDWGSTYAGSVPCVPDRSAPSSNWKSTFEASYENRSEEGIPRVAEDKKERISKTPSSIVLGNRSDRLDADGSTAAMVGLATPRNQTIGRQNPVVQSNRSSVSLGCEGGDWSTTMAGSLEQSSSALMDRRFRTRFPAPSPRSTASTSRGIVPGMSNVSADVEYVTSLSASQSAADKNCKVVSTRYRSVNNQRSVSEAGWRQTENSDTWNTTFNEGYGTEPRLRLCKREPIRVRMRSGAHCRKEKLCLTTSAVKFGSGCSAFDVESKNQMMGLKVPAQAQPIQNNLAKTNFKLGIHPKPMTTIDPSSAYYVPFDSKTSKLQQIRTLARARLPQND